MIDETTTAAKPTGSEPHEWQCAIEPNCEGGANMERDEAMAQACAADGIPRLRFYSWQPWTLSLGYNQDIAQINVQEVERRGYGLVRRPTGGRAVFHAEEITYSVAMVGKGEGVQGSYAAINQALLRGFQLLGAAGIEFNRSQPDFREHYASSESASCFSASALSELVWQGRKLAGSAQRRYSDVLLQHGSILLGDAHLEIIDLLNSTSNDPNRRERMRQMLRSRTATLAEVFNGATPSFTQIAQALREGFIQIFSPR